MFKQKMKKKPKKPKTIKYMVLKTHLQLCYSFTSYLPLISYQCNTNEILQCCVLPIMNWLDFPI